MTPTSHQPEHDLTSTLDAEVAVSDQAVVDDDAVDQTDDSAAEPATDGDSAGRAPQPDRPAPADLEKEGEIAADYLEDLLDIADLDGDIDMDVEGDRALVSVVGGDLDHLVGRNGAVLEALQELTRLAVHAQTGAPQPADARHRRLPGRPQGRPHRARRTTAETVTATGEKVRLEPMSPFERKVVHDAVAAAGLHSESEGEEPHRRVVVLPS